MQRQIEFLFVTYLRFGVHIDLNSDTLRNNIIKVINLQKDQQMLKELVDVLLIRSKFSTPTCFGIWLPSSGGRECLISYSSNVLCYGRERIMTRPVWPVVVGPTQPYIQEPGHFRSPSQS
jgi:hypothetical protein